MEGLPLRDLEKSKISIPSIIRGFVDDVALFL